VGSLFVNAVVSRLGNIATIDNHSQTYTGTTCTTRLPRLADPPQNMRRRGSTSKQRTKLEGIPNGHADIGSSGLTSASPKSLARSGYLSASRQIFAPASPTSLSITEKHHELYFVDAVQPKVGLGSVGVRNLIVWTFSTDWCSEWNGSSWNRSWAANCLTTRTTSAGFHMAWR